MDEKRFGPVRRLVLVPGDQLDRNSSAFDGFDPAHDAVWMCESRGEIQHVWNHKARIVLFLSAMRHFRDELREDGLPVDYTQLEAPANAGGIGENLRAAIGRRRPECVVMTEPGEHRVLETVKNAAREAGAPLDIRPDRHFYTSIEQFTRHAEGRKSLVMEFFYRELRKRESVLMEDGKPAGGAWNFDKENRHSFGKQGPPNIPPPRSFPPDETTRGVIDMVNRLYGGHPGRLDRFDFPVTRRDALRALTDFIENRLENFGRFQDAMWTDEPFLYHSRLASALNLKLLNPREAVNAAEEAWARGAVPIAAAEGFIRQILGWREYVRGIYWRFMPDYLEMNALGAKRDLPAFYWTGETDMACLRAAIGQTLEHGYAHHIQRLMVTGLYALLLGVDPKRVHEWYLAVYADAVEWVELPNTLGMSQYGDGGIMASKSYAASGKYIQRMGNYCGRCRFDPAKRTGENACPFTTLYWDFLLRHEKRFEENPRMRMQLRNLDRLEAPERKAIRKRAESAPG